MSITPPIEVPPIWPAVEAVAVEVRAIEAVGPVVEVPAIEASTVIARPIVIVAG